MCGYIAAYGSHRLCPCSAVTFEQTICWRAVPAHVSAAHQGKDRQSSCRCGGCPMVKYLDARESSMLPWILAWKSCGCSMSQASSCQCLSSWGWRAGCSCFVVC